MSERELEESAKDLIATHQYQSRRCNEHAADIVSVARAYLSSRQSILEEAAKVADDLRDAIQSGEIEYLGKGTPEIVACNRIAKAIRSLSHDGKAEKEKT